MRMAKHPSVLPGLLAILLSLAAFGFGQVIENPAKPKAKNAGRVIVPEQVLTISDEGTSDYYFKWPHGIKTAPDGSLFLLDESQVLRFDKNGKFGRNFFKKGQGPGEVNNVSACLPIEKNVIVHSPYPNKLVFFDLAGQYAREIPIRSETRSMMTALLFRGGAFYFETREFPRVKGDPDYVDSPHAILAVDAATGVIKTLTSFVTRAFVVTSHGGDGGGMFDITRLISVPFKQGLLALTHTEEYLIKIYDPEADKIIREFRRAYERVKPEPLTQEQKKGGVIIDGKHYGPPELKFQNDVRNLLARGDEIWAVTSTKDKTKGVLVDVFDGTGVFRDCFWLKLPEAALKSVLSPGQCALDGDFLWVVERSEDETFAIKKYRVVT